MNLQEIKSTLLNKNPKYNIETKYIKWYFNIIENALSENRIYYDYKQKKNPNYKYYERHHILPKAKGMFTEYEDFDKQFKWNKVLLTAKEHFIAHLCIWKHYKSINYTLGEKTMSRAVLGVQNSKACRFNSKLYSKFKLNLTLTDEHKRKNGLAHSGKNSSTALEIEIYTIDNKLFIESHGNFIQVCKEHGLPFKSLQNSYLNNGLRLYQTNTSLAIAKKHNNDKYYGWYALIKGSTQTNKGWLSEDELYKRNNNQLKGKHSHSSKIIYIYNEKGELMFTSHGNFKQVCEENGLPYSALCKSLRDGCRLYQNYYKKNSINMLINNGNIKYQGWYAKVIED